ncbi:MAG TPA: pyruvate kinase [Anaerolineales bacterium]
MEYEIVATLGPSSQTEPVWEAMLASGVTAFRLNTSHLTLKELQTWLSRVELYCASKTEAPPLVLDLQGSKWRLGAFVPFKLVAGQMVKLVHAAAAEQPQVLPVPHADFFKAAPVSSREIALNDARIRLSLEAIEPESLKARVIQGGEITSAKGITFTASDYRQETLNEKDRSILEQTQGLRFIRYAISYLRDAAEMERYRALCGPSTYLIAKLERQPALEEAARIAEQANELWLCRGDLGAELGIRAMAESVHRFTTILDRLPTPVLMAGQVLEHMTAHPTPTRAEICSLYDTLLAGYNGVVLSDEAAIGLYPVESCRAAALFKN